MTDVLRVGRHGHVLEVVLDRPKANAIDVATSQRMGEVFREFGCDPQLRVAIVTGTGRYFSAGWDLKAGDAGEHERMDYGVGGFAGITEMFNLNKPIVAAVNGYAIGGGAELALACDLVVAAESAEFAFPEARIGNVADGGGVQRLPRRIPFHIAMELLLTGRRMTATEAAGYGLVNAVVAETQLMERARAFAVQIAEGAPLSVQATKEVVYDVEAMSVKEAFHAVRAGHFPTYEKMLVSEDRREGLRAFVEKREPRFFGR